MAARSRLAGAGSPQSAGKRKFVAFAEASPAAPKAEPVSVIIDPPTPIADLELIYPSENNKRLCAVAKTCRHSNNWGCWQYNSEIPKWNNIHKESEPHKPRLNGNIVECLAITLQKFAESPACSAFSFRTSTGQVLQLGHLQQVEWTPIEELAEAAPAEAEPEDPRITALEVRVASLEKQVADLVSLISPPS